MQRSCVEMSSVIKTAVVVVVITLTFPRDGGTTRTASSRRKPN